MPKKNNIKGLAREYLPLVPIIFAIGIIPLIVRIQYYDPQLAQYSWFPDNSNVMDMFMYWKQKAMVQLDALLLVGYFFLWRKKELPKEKLYIPLGIYLALIILSSICSVSPTHTWKGFFGMLESAFVLFGYCMICYYAFAILKSEKQIKIVMCALAVGVFVLCGIGISQFLGADFYMSDFGKDLIFPSEYAGYKDNLQLTMGEGRVYASLYNPNYVGVYGCLLLPIFMVLSFISKEKWQYIVTMVLASMILVCIVGAKNKTAMFVFIPLFVFMIICFARDYWKRMIPTFAILAVVFLASNLIQGEKSLLASFLGKVNTAFDELEEQDSGKKIKSKLESIDTLDEYIKIVYDGETLFVKYLQYEGGSWKIEIKDADGVLYTTEINETQDGFDVQHEKFENLDFYIGMDQSMNVGFKITVGKEEYFTYRDTVYDTYYYVNSYGRRAKIYSGATWDSPVFHLFGGISGRGYIWSKTVPILEETFFVGSGPDTYSFMFPQYDYVSLKQDGWKSLITKPHSMYLQIGVNTGVISLIAFLIFYLGYFIQSFKLYWMKKREGFVPGCGVAIWMGSICFMLSSIMNDSTIGVSIIYWTLIGVGFACNMWIKNENNL